MAEGVLPRVSVNGLTALCAVLVSFWDTLTLIVWYVRNTLIVARKKWSQAEYIRHN